MRKPWQTKEWQEKRAEFIKGKSCEWCDSTDYLTIHHPQAQRSLSYDEYMSFEGIMILCRRCAWACHKGMHLCPKCKKKYARQGYEVCFNCLPSEEKKWIEEYRKEQFVSVTTPCGRTEVIDKLAFEVMGVFEVCHNCDKVNDCKLMEEI